MNGGPGPPSCMLCPQYSSRSRRGTLGDGRHGDVASVDSLGPTTLVVACEVVQRGRGVGAQGCMGGAWAWPAGRTLQEGAYDLRAPCPPRTGVTM